jgi:putative heme-binding domain-containing protein
MKRAFFGGVKLLAVVLATASLRADAQPSALEAPLVQMLVPGFTVRELPVKLTSLNNIEYAPDGRLFAGGYDGRFHLLRDTDGDGLEDRVDTFSPESSPNYPLGLVVQNGDPYTVLTDEVVRFRDTDGDGVPDRRETVAKGFDDPKLVAAPYLNHRRVDSSLALAIGPDGAIYLTMGNAAHSNAYMHDKEGVAHYSPIMRRGCLLRIGPDGKVEQLATGLRYVMSLQWNRHGDLFATDQEGATWVPNGNPADELLHIQPGRHYGFPPRHPQFLPDVVDEPSVWDFMPQHQSTCGFRFNGPAPGRGRFGPEFWANDALITGESRGKLWRTTLAKTAAGYVARTNLIASIGMLVVDCAVSPQGDLVICGHSGRPDWGNGPTGTGWIFKIRHTDTAAPQPVLMWPANETQAIVALDRPLTSAAAETLAARAQGEYGRYVAAADRWEFDRPGYAVVQMQQRQPRNSLPVKAVRPTSDGRGLSIETAPRLDAVNYAFTLGGGTIDLAHDLSGLAVHWRGEDSTIWSGWLPHPDFAAARQFTRASGSHDELWNRIATPGKLTLRGQLDLFNMLQPATQPGSRLDYTPQPETVTVMFRSDAALHLHADGATVERIGDRESRLVASAPMEERWQSIRLELATPAERLDVSFFTDRDPRPRALATRRFLVPFARPGTRDVPAREIPEIASGDWHSGREVFRGKGACANCHAFRGAGFPLGPDLSNLAHRDYASVLRDVIDPSAVINPDAIGYVVMLDDGEIVTGARLAETADQLHLAQAGGRILKLRKSDIDQTEPMTISLMPAGVDKVLSPAELRDLLTYLLSDEPRPVAKPRAAGSSKL